jgi:competence protein ComEA
MKRGGFGRAIGIATVAVLALGLVAGGAGANEKGTKDDKPARAESRVNINEATRAQLMKLSGVGPGTADRIISYRQAHGPFRRAQDLEKVEGVGKGVLEKNEGRIAVK